MAIIPEALEIIGLLTEGKKVTKCKLDGKLFDVVTGRIKADIGLSSVTVDCTAKDDAQTLVIEAVHTRSDQGNKIRIGGQAMQEADIDMTVIPHLFAVDLKATLQYKAHGASHEIEIYCRLKSLI